jgi:PAS domain S-box-containing protein
MEEAITSLKADSDLARHNREDAQCQSDEWFYKAFHASPAAISISRLADGLFIDVNEKFVHLLGYSRNELIGHTSIELGMFSSPAEREKEVQILREQGSIRDRESKVCTRSGEILHALLSVELIEIRYEVCALTMIQDKTHQKLAEEARLRAEEKYRRIFEGAADGIFQTTLDGRFITVNPAMARMCGYKSPEELTANVTDVERQVYVNQERRREFKRLLEEQEVLQGFEIQIRRSDGSHIWVSENARIVRGTDGEPLYFEGSCEEITGRKMAEAALRVSEERYRELFENANDMIFTIDLLGNFTSINKTAETISGYAREEVLSMSIADMVPEKYLEPVRVMLEDMVAGKEIPGIIELEFIAKDKRKVAVEVSMRPRCERGRPVEVEGIARDVSQRLLLEAQLLQSQKMEAVGRLSGGVAHDFNNLLTVILGYTQFLMTKLGSESPHSSDLEAIRAAGERAAGLTRQLLAFSRRQMLHTAVIDLNFVIEDLQKMLRPLIGEDVDLILLPESGLRPVVADKGQIEQIIMNLAVNSRDAMPQGGKLTIRTANVDLDEAYVRAHVGSRPGPYVLLEVSDTGCGMDDATMDHIFEPFFTTKEQGKGTGLGMSTVYGIVKQSGGYIWIESSPGRGTSCKIYFPRIEAPAPASKVHESTGNALCGAETILLVEDEVWVGNLARLILERQGYKVYQARSAEEALSIGREQKGAIDMVLADVVMPIMSGRELAEFLLPLHPGMKVLFMSGYTDDTILQHGVMDLGIGFLQKPFTSDTLIQKVREVLDTPA